MAEWRERGYVPDSDDEGSDEEARADHCGLDDENPQDEKNIELLATEALNDPVRPSHQLSDHAQSHPTSTPVSQTATISNTSKALETSRDDTTRGGSQRQELPEPSTAQKLEAQLASGLRTCSDILNSRPITPVLSDLDSPLSSLPSSPEAPDFVVEAERDLSNQLKSHSSFPVGALEQLAIPASTLHPGLIGRSFRPRALMQLHPYTIEYAKYQKDWTARGLPPIRSADPKARREDEMQATATFGSSQNLASLSGPSSPTTDAMSLNEDESQSAMPPSRHVQHQRDLALDDELPDLADILRSDAKKFSTAVVRKRKARRREERNHRPKTLPRLDLLTDKAQDLLTDSQRGAVFDLPPSPPRSAHLSPSMQPSSGGDYAGLQVATPGPLPTPVLSSDRQVTVRDIIEVSSSSEPETESGDNVSSPSNARASGDESQGLMQMKRKIKGVLPASWLRLDAQHQRHPSAHRQHSTSPVKRGPNKGLAKHVVMSGRSGHDEDGKVWPADISSDEGATESASDDPEFSRPVASQQFRIQSALCDDEALMDGVIIQDEIDAMVPAASRASRRGSRPRKKRQQRLEGDWLVDDQNKLERKQQPGQLGRSNTSHRTYHISGHKRRKVKEKQQQFSVLDAPCFTVDTEIDMPRFLKVAARAKGSSRGTAPQDARQKFFELSTIEDTAEINDGLRNWASGLSSRIRASKSHVKSPTSLRQNSHAPRHAQPHKGVNIHADSDAQIRKLKTSTSKTLSRLQKPAAPISATARALPGTDSGQRSSSAHHLGAFFSHVNRSGDGSLLNPTFARAGQLEVSRASLQLARRTLRLSNPVRKAAPHHLAMGEPSNLSPPALPQRASHQRKRKMQPTMAVNADAAGQRVSATSGYSERIESRRDPGGRLSHTDDTIGSYYRVWLRNMSSLPKSTIIQDLRSLTSPRPAPFPRSPFISQRRFEQVLSRLEARRESVRDGSIDLIIPARPTTLIARSVASNFKHIELLTFANSTQPVPSKFLSQNAIEHVFSSLAILQNELGDSSWFRNLPATAQLPSFVLDNLDGALRAWTSFLGSAGPSDKVVCTFVFGQLLVCAYQIADIATEANDDDLLQRALRHVEEAAYQAVYSALETTGCRWTPAQSYETDACGPLPIEAPPNLNIAEFIQHCRSLLRTYHFSYVVDTVIIVYHLVQRRRIPGAKFDFEYTLHRICSADSLAEQPLVQLASVIAVVRLICPLTRLDIAGEAVLDKGFNGWHLLSQVAQSSISVAQENAPRTDHSLEMYRVKEQTVFIVHCFAFITEWGWDDPDAFLKSMFAVYAKNNLVDLNVMSKEEKFRRPFREIALPTTEQGDFKGLLWLVTTVLRDRSALVASSDARTQQTAASKLSALVFALLPNNTLPFHREVKIQENHYCSLANHYDLYLTLYVNASTRARPGPRMFKDLVDFQICPGKIRELTIEVWKDLTLYAISSPDAAGDVAQLVDWASEMLEYLAYEFTTSCVYVMNETGHGVSNSINSHEDLSYSITAMLREWKTVLCGCSGATVEMVFPRKVLTALAIFVSSANTQLSDFDRTSDGSVEVLRYNRSPETAGTAFHGFAAHPRSLRFEPYVAAMELLKEVVGKVDLKESEFRRVANSLARDILATILSCKGGWVRHDGQTCDVFRDVLVAISDAWFKIASSSIGLTRSWEEYLTAPSKLSFPILSDSEFSRQCKTLFMARMIQDNPMNFTMDRTTFYAAWVEGMMVPEQFMAFEHVLGAEINRYDPTPTLISGVFDKLTLNDKTFPIMLQRLKAERFEILRSLIAAIYSLQMNPPMDDESQLSVDGALSSGDLASLLRVMTDTIKRYWQAGLATGEQQSAYQLFIQKVAVELKTYDFEGFTIDKWFTDPDGPGFLKTTTGFGHYFDLPVGASPKPVSQAMVQAFRTSLISASMSDELSLCDQMSKEKSEREQWHREMLAAFSCSEVDAALTDDLQLKVDVRLQKQFLRVVLPVYVEVAVASPAAVTLLAAVVRLLVELARAAHIRVKEADDREEVWDLAVSLLRLAAWDGREWEGGCLEVKGKEVEMREWTRRDLVGALEGMAVDAEVNGGVEEVAGLVKVWEEGLREEEEEEEAQRRGWQELGLVFE